MDPRQLISPLTETGGSQSRMILGLIFEDGAIVTPISRSLTINFLFNLHLELYGSFRAFDFY